MGLSRPFYLIKFYKTQCLCQNQRTLACSGLERRADAERGRWMAVVQVSTPGALGRPRLGFPATWALPKVRPKHTQGFLGAGTAVSW